MTTDPELKVTGGPLIILELDMRMRRVETGSSVSSRGCANAPTILLRPSLVGKGWTGIFFLVLWPLVCFQRELMDLQGLSPWATFKLNNSAELQQENNVSKVCIFNCISAVDV